MRTLIEGGQIVNEGRCFEGSIVIEDEKIIEILKKGQGNCFGIMLSEV